MRIEKATISKYITSLKDKYRPPSKGGNTRAWHAHFLVINDDMYSFLALGARKWVYAGDCISFEWDWSPDGKYRNIRRDSIRTWDKNGSPVVRGERGSKP
jgi:hypothetical protein